MLDLPKKARLRADQTLKNCQKTDQKQISSSVVYEHHFRISAIIWVRIQNKGTGTYTKYFVKFLSKEDMP